MRHFRILFLNKIQTKAKNKVALNLRQSKRGVKLVKVPHMSIPFEIR